MMYLLNLLITTAHHVKNKQSTAALFLDLQKVFDTVCPGNMIYRLKELGIEGNFLRVVNSFLTERKISLKVDNNFHQAKKCNIGLSQGSVLSPLLFIIYIRDMLTDTDGICSQYADNCTVLVTGEDSLTLQNKMDTNCRLIQSWMTQWKLVINYQKTEIFLFRGHLTPLQINGNDVLGITVNSQLTFGKQQSHSPKTLTQRVNMLKPFTCIYAGLRW